MYFRIFVIFHGVCSSVCSGLIDFSSCPAGPLWKYRAVAHCSVPEQYHCLFDSFNSDRENAIYVERCFPPKRYKGKRYVVNGYLDAEDCQKENYSPYPITSNVNTGAECPLKKSLCNEEGQVTVSDGSSSEDRTCRCSFEEGYRYINEPPNPCSCHPFLQDCSCYKDICSVVTGNTCKHPTYIKIICEKPLNTDIDSEIVANNVSPDFIQENTDNSRHSRHTDKKTARIVVLILVIIAICIGAFFGVFVAVQSGNIANVEDDRKEQMPVIPRAFVTEHKGKNDTGAIETAPIQRKPREKHVEDIYREDMFVVEYYVNTAEVDRIENALETKRIVVLQGLHGCGKTQSAHKFCEEFKTRYSVVGKLEFDSNVSFVDTVEKFARKLNLKISHEINVDSSTMISNIKKYFQQRKRGSYHYLLFLDKVDIENNKHYDDIRKLIQLTKEISDLDIIVATTDKTFANVFSNDQICRVEFTGMKEEEYKKLFEEMKCDVKDKLELVDTVGRMPIVLTTAVFHLKTTQEDIKRYIKRLKQLRCTYENLNVAITSQLPSLNYVESQLKERWSGVWEIVTFLPFLCYGSISVVVLEALYYHRVKHSSLEMKEAIDKAIVEFSKVCLCHIKEIRAHVETDIRYLIFHEVTMFALNIKNDLTDEERNYTLTFLLKTFCYEIDIDARTDLTVARNLLFIEHAEKLLTIIEEDDICTNDRQMQFFQSYLHCAIGSTLLFQRTEVHNAHKHLMKARRIGLLLVQDESVFDKNVCTYQRKDTKGTEKPDPLKIKEVASNLYKESRNLFADDFVIEFLTGKRRNQNDVDVIKVSYSGHMKLGVFKCYYLSEEDYKELLECNLALDVNCVSQLLLPELILRILHNNARALYELSYTTDREDKEGYKRLQDACYAEVINSITLREEVCSLMTSEEIQNAKMFVCLESERSGSMLSRWYQMELEKGGMDIRREFESDIAKYENMIENYEGEKKVSDGIYFDFGIVKISRERYIRHTAMCRRILLRYLMKAYDEEKEPKEKEEIAQKCLRVSNKLEKQLEEMEGDISRHRYSWLSIPLLCIQCGNCHLMTDNPERALACFDEALKFETKRNAHFTRFIIEGNEGKIKCLIRLRQIEEAVHVADQVIKNNEGKNRDNVVNKFRKLRDEITANPHKSQEHL